MDPHYLKRAEEHLCSAEHILSITYPAIKSPKLFLSALEHLFLAMDYSMNQILLIEKNKGMIKSYPNTFTGRFSAFRMNCLKPHKIPLDLAETLYEMRNTLLEHRKSPMEFSRNEGFVICNNEYQMKILTMESSKNNLEKAKGLFKIVEKIAREEPLSTSEDSHTHHERSA